MTYDEDNVRTKLSNLQDTQDSVASAAHWVMFHRRHANQIAQTWYKVLQDCSVSRRLPMIYVANEIVQQQRARKHTEFQYAFEPLIADAVALTYKSASQDLQGKIKRVVEVWRQRDVFAPSIQDAVENRMVELDKQRPSKANGAGGGKLGGSLFGGGAGGSVPAELEKAAKSQAGVSRAEVGTAPALEKANAEYNKMTDPNTPVPTAPVHAAKLSGVMKSLATAQGAVESGIKAREELVQALEELLERNRVKLAEDNLTLTSLSKRKDEIEFKKREVEDTIMRGLSTPTSPDNPTPPTTNGSSGKRQASQELQAPEAEGFTPPPPDVEAFTPPTIKEDEEEDTKDSLFPDNADPIAIPGYTPTTGAERIKEEPINFNEPPPSIQLPGVQLPGVNSAALAADDFLSSLPLPGQGQAQTQTRQASSQQPAGGDPRLLKRRKMSHRETSVDEDIFGQGAVGGVDEEGISALLGS